MLVIRLKLKPWPCIFTPYLHLLLSMNKWVLFRIIIFWMMCWQYRKVLNGLEWQPNMLCLSNFIFKKHIIELNGLSFYLCQKNSGLVPNLCTLFICYFRILRLFYHLTILRQRLLVFIIQSIKCILQPLQFSFQQLKYLGICQPKYFHRFSQGNYSSK